VENGKKVGRDIRLNWVTRGSEGDRGGRIRISLETSKSDRLRCCEFDPLVKAPIDDEEKLKLNQTRGKRGEES